MQKRDVFGDIEILVIAAITADCQHFQCHDFIVARVALYIQYQHGATPEKIEMQKLDVFGDIKNFAVKR